MTAVATGKSSIIELINDSIFSGLIATNTTVDKTNLQNKKDTLFCGSYFGYGFHEDGIKSSLEMLKNLND